jgi:peptide deformylase
MSILKIARLGHPVLRRRADPVGDPTRPEIQRLIADLGETMRDAEGLGLAAPQVHVSLRLFVWRAPEGLDVLVDPELTPLDDAFETGWEGCLSIPGLRGAVTRAARIRFRGLDASGAPIEGEAGGMLARVMQHEADHLDGVLYPDKLADPMLFGFSEEIARAAAAAAP